MTATATVEGSDATLAADDATTTLTVVRADAALELSALDVAAAAGQ